MAWSEWRGANGSPKPIRRATRGARPLSSILPSLSVPKASTIEPRWTTPPILVPNIPVISEAFHSR
eukprot:scaffold1638_cov258-Pinguiococcus_pyrenoidosus.AAC.58